MDEYENELYIIYGNAGYVYFPTNSMTIDDAMTEYEMSLKAINLDACNLIPTEITLRTYPEGEEIESDPCW